MQMLNIHKPHAPLATPTIGPDEPEGVYMARLYQAGDCSLSEARSRARKQALERDVVNIPPDDFETLRGVLLRLIRGN